MCSEHFEAKHIVKTLCGITKPAKGTVPTMFNPKTVPRSPSQREKRTNERKKRKASEDNNIMFPAKTSRVSPDVGLRDHDYVPKDNKVHVISSSQTVINANEVRVCFRFLPNGHRPTTNGGSYPKRSKVKN